jgi:hypothetical protein
MWRQRQCKQVAEKHLVPPQAGNGHSGRSAGQREAWAQFPTAAVSWEDEADIKRSSHHLVHIIVHFEVERAKKGMSERPGPGKLAEEACPSL